MHDGEGIKSCAQIVDDDAGAFRKPLQTADWKRLQNIEDTKEYKAREKRFPGEGNGDKRNELARDLVDDNELRIFQTRAARYASGCGDADGRDDSRGDDGCPSAAAGCDFEARA